jgi:N-carbamoyl-L-amino-acid hydrolase
VELHIEQGDVLDTTRIPIGVVEGIVGIVRYLVTFHGEANHAGTTGMQRRRDALVAAAPYIQRVRAIALDHGIVGTVGKVDVEPGAPNVIPGRVTLYVEMRGLDEQVLLAAQDDLARTAQELGGVLEQVAVKPPVRAHPLAMAAVTRACDRLKLDFRVMPSGAGHDAMNMAALCPMAMIFVPSQGGISHSPHERTAAEDCVHGAQVLLQSLLELDESLDS